MTNLLIYIGMAIIASALWLTWTIANTREVFDNHGNRIPEEKNKFKTPPGIGYTVNPTRPYKNTGTWLAYIRMKQRETANKNRHQ